MKVCICCYRLNSLYGINDRNPGFLQYVDDWKKNMQITFHDNFVNKFFKPKKAHYIAYHNATRKFFNVKIESLYVTKY